MSTPSSLYDEAVKIYESGEVEQAVEKLKEVLAADENYVLAHSASAVYYQKLGKFDEAIEHAKKVTELEPDDNFSYLQLSVICQRCGRIAEAEDALAKAHSMGQKK
ncbi:Tetratricopeptide repeat protein [Gimesia panareensis]|uniref:Tetratricopeptide repeat protein n=1 Tax=Gimesia panareensis TaxID=2527978 RepID=A0A518FX06_9PLAN|nr:tetratricopeptide repeat protein [Gimesia panareensis]QDT29944.1 Tetratricopeptide repeat protein [Gimesia panareensis]QDV20923.1 Tetratricopeptide repeat protein [Gimesia panareensis]